MKTKLILGNLFLLLISCIVAFAMGEIVMRSLGYYGQEIGSVAPEQMLVDDDILDYRVPPNIKRTTAYGYLYETNSKGWRDHEYAYEKTEDTFRIVIIGDSVLNGHGVRTEEIYAKYLERRLNGNSESKKYEVIMLSIGALNTIQEAHLLRQEGVKYDPDLVIVGYVLNDPSSGFSLRRRLEKNKKEHSLYLRIRRSLKQSALLLHSYDALEKFASRLGIQFGNEKFTLKVTNTDQNYYESLHKDEKSWQRVVEGLTQISKTAKSKDIPVIVAIFPIFFQMDSYRWADVHAKVTEESQSHGMYVLDLLSFYQPLDEITIRRGPGDYIHPNAKGHEVAGEAIFSFLSDNNLLHIDGTD